MQPSELVREMLEARGEVITSIGDSSDDRLLRSRIDVGLSPSTYEESLSSHTFRRLLHTLTERRPTTTRSEADLAIASGCHDSQKLRSYLTVLEDHGIVERVDQTWRLAGGQSAARFGPTLEWIVHQKLNEYLHWNAAWSVCLDGCPVNDFDVIACRGSDLLVVECKAGREFTVKEAEAILQRHEYLRPNMSMVLVDTHNSIKPVAKTLYDCYWGGDSFAPDDPEPELYVRALVNLGVVSTDFSQKRDDILAALRRGLREYFRPPS